MLVKSAYLVAAGDKAVVEEIKRRGHVCEEGQSKQTNLKILNSESISYQALFRLWTEY